MKIQTPTEFQTFADGICSVWTTLRNQPDKELYHNLHFGAQSLTYRRAYAARAVRERIDRVIRIPYVNGVEQGQQVHIGTARYTITQVQPIESSNPRVKVLTLGRLEGL